MLTRKRSLTLVLFFFALSSIANANSNVYKQLVKSTAMIVTADGHGSGALIDAERKLVFTNYHVVEGPGPVMLGFSDGQADIRAQVVAKDEQLDLALLRAGRQLGPPLPVAKQKLAELEKLDPETIERAKTFFPFGPGAKPVGSPAPTESGEPAAAPAVEDDTRFVPRGLPRTFERFVG